MLLIPLTTGAQPAPIKRIALYPKRSLMVQPELPIRIPETMTEIVAEEDIINPNMKISLPLSDYRLTSAFGWRKHPTTGKRDFHNGVDLAARTQPVFSIMDGKVEATGYHRNLGNYVRVDHGYVQSIYGHLSRITVTNGQSIASGYPVGITGKTGRTTGEHLHFSIRMKGTYIDPWKFLHGIIQYFENKH
ncbi:M23 family metallopeptidase [Sphingobacterium mizutaii]|uniref:M23 family metallopeptidase n=1 Tax=Sphingobacterium mizutaii TaxID=1010 RepID=UPI001628F5B1|nr:M23 family metallopeptidase [Sphingobacterium mizutaii]